MKIQNVFYLLLLLIIIINYYYLFNYTRSDGLIHLSFDGKMSPDMHVSLSFT